MAPHAEIDASSANGFDVTASPAAAPQQLFTVNSPNVTYTDTEIKSRYTYHTTDVRKGADGQFVATPKNTVYDFKVDRKVPKLGVMLVGWGGNNGSTISAAIIANRRGLTWKTREGTQKSNYYGSILMGSTMKLGTDADTKEDVNIPFNQVLPMVHPNDLIVGGWDISSMNMADAMDRAQVLEPSLKDQVRKEMATLTPLPSIYYPDFIAANQGDRADNVIPGSKACNAHVERIRKDIQYVICAL